jgi:hypothetical protein
MLHPDLSCYDTSIRAKSQDQKYITIPTSFRLASRHIWWSSNAKLLHRTLCRSISSFRPVLAPAIVVAPIGHPVAHGDVQEAGAQTGLRQVFGPDVARHQCVRPRAGTPSGRSSPGVHGSCWTVKSRWRIFGYGFDGCKVQRAKPPPRASALSRYNTQAAQAEPPIVSSWRRNGRPT